MLLGWGFSRLYMRTKEEIKNAFGMRINEFSNTPLWREAFELYNSIHRTRLEPNCNKCYETVKGWLER